MFNVQLSVTVRASNGAFGLRRNVTIPFAPYPGLYLWGVFELEEDETEGGTVQHVSYDLNTGKFAASIDDEEYRWPGPFTPDDAGYFFRAGCQVDDRASLEEWTAQVWPAYATGVANA